MYDLTAFQRDLLFVINSLDGSNGQEIKAELEESQNRDISRTRLYSNLNTLVSKGLVEKAYDHGRTNQYTPTEEGRRAVQSRFEWEKQYLSATAP
jgi:DNA-binding PadR family transcriptional regulator